METTKNIFTMKQPALGQHILALRQEKGFTQEDLVAQCNISVRTIQRIEAGEVVPRSYTVKTILAALGEDFESFTESTVESGLKKAFFLKIDDTQQANFLTKHLKIAWIAGANINSVFLPRFYFKRKYSQQLPSKNCSIYHAYS